MFDVSNELAPALSRDFSPRRIFARSVVEQQACFDGDFDAAWWPCQELRIRLSRPLEPHFVSVLEERTYVALVSEIEDHVGFAFGHGRLGDDLGAFRTRHGFPEYGREERKVLGRGQDVQTNKAETSVSVRVHVTVQRDLVPPEERAVDFGGYGEVGIDVVFAYDRRTAEGSRGERERQEERGTS